MSRAKNLSNKVMINGKPVYFDSHADATEARENSSGGGSHAHSYDVSSTQTRYVQVFISPGATLKEQEIIYYPGNYVTAGIDSELFWGSSYAPQGRSLTDPGAAGINLEQTMIAGVYMGEDIAGDSIDQAVGVPIEIIQQGVVTLRQAGFYPAKGSGVGLTNTGTSSSSYVRDPMRQGAYMLPGWKQVQSREEDASAFRLFYINGNVWPIANPPSGTVSEAAPAGGGSFG